MAIDKSVNQAPKLSVVVDTKKEAIPDIEVVIEEDGGAVIEIGEQENEVDFHANLADVIEQSELRRIALDLLPCMRQISLLGKIGSRCILMVWIY